MVLFEILFLLIERMVDWIVIRGVGVLRFDTLAMGSLR